MKLVATACLALGLVACSRDPQRQDLEMFCSPDAMVNGSALPAVGEYVLAHVHARTLVADVFFQAKVGPLTASELAQSLAIQLDAEHITDCPTYTKMWGARRSGH